MNKLNSSMLWCLVSAAFCYHQIHLRASVISLAQMNKLKMWDLWERNRLEIVVLLPLFSPNVGNIHLHSTVKHDSDDKRVI